MTVKEGPIDEPAPRVFPYFSEVLQEETGAGKYLTPYPTALQEIGRRSKDLELRKRVEDYLGGDVPSYFGTAPVLYLARHIATPNFETLRFMHLLQPLGLPIIISQDTKDLFSSRNAMKRALCKMSICERITSSGGQTSEHYRNKTIVDFSTAQGKPLCDITTIWGENLVDFHARLFSTLSGAEPHFVDDSEWIDRNGRGNLLAHYKKFLALFIVHGVLFEDYVIEDSEEEYFVREILGPAFLYVEEKFGVRPLITQLVPSSVESVRFWMSYPKDTLNQLKAVSDTNSTNI